MAQRNPQIDALNTRLKEFKDKLSKIRKSGIKTSEVNILLLNVPPKIQIAAVTLDPKDIEKATKAILDLEQRLQLTVKEAEEDKKLNESKEA